mgnify:CR=1 FL=1
MATKAKDLTVEEKLTALHNMQTIHKKIDELHKLRGELPLEVNDLEDEIEGLNTRANKLTDEIQGINDFISESKNKIQDAETLKEKYEKQINNVKNNREYDALTKEIENQDLDVQLLNKKSKQSEEDIKAKEEYLKKSKAVLKSKEKDLVEKKKELEVISADTEKEEIAFLKKIKTAENKIEDRLLNAYKRIRNTYKNRLAVVTIERNACGGCFAKIPPQRQLELRQRKKILLCEHCGRILVDDEM